MEHHFIRGIVLVAAGIGFFGAACTYEPPSASNTGGEGGQGTGGSVSTSGVGGNVGSTGGTAGMGGSAEASSSSGSGGAGGGAATDWWDKAWQHRVKISFKNAGGELLKNFPVLVMINEKVATGISASNTGADIRFVDADGKTVLPYEIDGWNAQGNSLVWVNVPGIEATDMDYIWLYYGNSGASPAQQAQAVWNGFTTVYHLSEPAAPIANSVGGKEGVWKSTAGTAAAGMINGAIQFNGVGYLELGENSVVDVGLDQARTIEAWAHPDSANQHQAIVWQEGQCVGWSLKTNFMGQFEGRLITDQALPLCGAGTVEVPVVSKFSVGGWHYLALVIDRPAGVMTLHVNGVAKNSLIIDNIGATDGNGFFQIGGGFMGSTFLGAIDEVRVSDKARTPGWIAAQHKSMTGNFTTFGP